MKRVVYSLATKNKVIEMKVVIYMTKELWKHKILGIENKWKLDVNDIEKSERHRFNQQDGKLYDYSKGLEELLELEQLKLENKRKDIEIAFNKI